MTQRKGRNTTMQLYKQYVERNLIDNQDDVYNIIDAASAELERKFDIACDEPDMLITIFGVTFNEFVKELQKRSATKDHYKVIIASRLEIGFNNAKDEEYEKNGGFMFYIKHLYQESKDDELSREYGNGTIELCNEWNSVNIQSDNDFIKVVVMNTHAALKKLDIALESHEVIIPIFITIYDTMIFYIKTQRATLNEFEYEINFISLFDVKAVQGEDLEDSIIFTPSIENKLALKSDQLATSKYD